MKKLYMVLVLSIAHLGLITYMHSEVIAVIGSGYVGLVTGAGLADVGHTVICVDIDQKKIQDLQHGIIPIYEPGLDEIIARNVAGNRLSFSSDIPAAIRMAPVIFTAVGTPMGEDGAADIRAVESVANMVAEYNNGYKVLCTKSTVPIGTGSQIRSLLELKGASDKIEIVSNPEFLREGSAVSDFLYPDRIVIGVESERARAIMEDIYKPFAARNIPIIYTTILTSEMVKYASNAFLAVKISYINELANLCDTVGADVNNVAHAMGLDKRISPYFLNSGPGFGGSCFPKDCHALVHTAENCEVELNIVRVALEANERQKEIPVLKLRKLLVNYFNDKKQQSFVGRTIAILGLAFKANTDDIRYSPAITTIELLLEKGAHIKAYDPAAMENMRRQFPGIDYCQSMYEAVMGVDAIIIMTEWDEFKTMDLEQIGDLVKHKVIVDARNILDQQKLDALGFCVDFIGCGSYKSPYSR